MHSELRIVRSNDLNTRSYICFYFNGKRVREFNGKNLGLDIKPNYAQTIPERDKLLKKLEFELQKALENNAYPVIRQEQSEKSEEPASKDTGTLLLQALNQKLNSSLSKFYKRNLAAIHKHFTEFLAPEELKEDLKNIKKARIDEFLSRYKSSGTYYMNKRGDLGVLFSVASADFDVPVNTILKTERMKSKATLHQIYEKDQIQPILEFLKSHHPNLYLCCLISYGCFLRPHQEVRNLTGLHFKKNYTEIHLSGSENKGGRVRVVNVPDYVNEALSERTPHFKPEVNIFTLSEIPYNDAYFNTAWTRAWAKMFKKGLIRKNQTIYSFRHTAAVNVYRRTKDLHILQQLLGHSNMIVTLKYLRGLGELNTLEHKEYMPVL